MLLLSMVLSVSCFAQESEEDESSVSKTAKSVVSGIVSFGKNLVDGVTDGRKTGQSTDDAIIVDTLEGLDKNLIIELISISKDDEETSYIELGFKNANGKPVRIINLADSGTVIAIDTDGYSTNLARGKGNPDDITVPSNTGKKQKFYFKLAPEAVKEIRVMGKIIAK